MRVEISAVFGVILILSAPIISASESSYSFDDDGWLTQLAGPERLALGDEFGCHGMPEVNLLEDSGSVDACVTYLNERIAASKWGENPLTFGVPDNSAEHPNSQNLTDALYSAGIRVVDDLEFGEQSGILNSFEVNAGTLEKGIASIDSILSSAKDEEIVVLSWIAEMEDLNVRRDRDVVSWIEDQSFWFTTPGELVSSKSSGNLTLINYDNSTVTIEQPNQIAGLWATPGNSLISGVDMDGQNLEVISVTYSNGTELEEFDSMNRHLTDGWRFENGSLHLSLIPGTNATIQYNPNQSISNVSISNNTFNGLIPFIVYGEHVTDLFEWSSGFQNSSIRFTWLVEPRPVIQMDWVLPIIAGFVGLITIVQMRRLIRSDNLSPELYRNLFESE